MAHKGLPNKKIRCVRTTMMARSTSSHVRPDRLARTKMTIPFEFPCNARPVHRYGGMVCPHPETIEIAWVLRDRLKASDPEGRGGLKTWNATRPPFVEADAVQRA